MKFSTNFFPFAVKIFLFAICNFSVSNSRGYDETEVQKFVTEITSWGLGSPEGAGILEKPPKLLDHLFGKSTPAYNDRTTEVLDTLVAPTVSISVGELLEFTMLMDKAAEQFENEQYSSALKSLGEVSQFQASLARYDGDISRLINRLETVERETLKRAEEERNYLESPGEMANAVGAVGAAPSVAAAVGAGGIVIIAAEPLIAFSGIVTMITPGSDSVISRTSKYFEAWTDRDNWSKISGFITALDGKAKEGKPTIFTDDEIREIEMLHTYNGKQITAEQVVDLFKIKTKTVKWLEIRNEVRQSIYDFFDNFEKIEEIRRKEDELLYGSPNPIPEENSMTYSAVAGPDDAYQRQVATEDRKLARLEEATRSGGIGNRTNGAGILNGGGEETAGNGNAGSFAGDLGSGNNQIPANGPVPIQSVANPTFETQIWDQFFHYIEVFDYVEVGTTSHDVTMLSKGGALSHENNIYRNSGPDNPKGYVVQTKEHLAWGRWEGSVKVNHFSGAQITSEKDREPGYWIAGQLTPAGAVPMTGTATYNGEIQATATEYSGPDHLNSSNNVFSSEHYHYYPLTGNLKMEVDFENSTIGGEVYNLNYRKEGKWVSFLDKGDLNGIIPRTTTNTGEQRSFSVAIDGGTEGAGSMRGYFFGPNAEQIGGHFRFDKSPFFKASGIFWGSQ